MFPGAKIIVIDDDEVDLKSVIVALKSLGLACISYHYPDEKPEAGVSFGGIRLFITDINLLGGDSPGDEARKLAPAISLIERIVAKDNGPYALITWSTTDLHDAFIARIRRTKSLGSRQPFFSMPLVKAEFLDDPGKLKKAIEHIFTTNAPFGALLDWERRVSKAGEKVLGNIESFAQQFPGNDPSQKMDRMLSKLAVDAFGKAHVVSHLFESVNEALLPILGDALNTEFFSMTKNEIWDKAVTKIDEDNAITEEIIAKLNSAVIFEALPDIKPYRRGAVLELPAAWIAEDEFEKRFGAKPDRIRGDLLKLDKPKKPRWVLVQAQAACDFAQDRIGPIPYLLAAIVPENYERKKGKDGNPLHLPASIWQSPRLAKYTPICSTDFHLEVLHGITCQITRKGLEEVGFKVLGRLKDQIVSSIAYEYHSHGARPGFVSFR